MNRYVCLQVFLDLKGAVNAANNINLLLPEKEGYELHRNWASGHYKATGKAMLNGTTVDGVEWAVKTEAIKAITTIPVERTAQGFVPIAAKPPAGSGLN